MGHTRSHHPNIPRFARLLALAGLVLTAAGLAQAGPRVGETIGRTATVSTTVQARVISATPVIGQVSVPRETCYDESRHVPPRSSGAGAVMGAIAGGAMGNAVGKGSGNALATGLGIFGGAILGDKIENDGRPGSSRMVRRCEQQSGYENRVVAYNVVYEYGGQRYTTQMSREPGRTLPLRVTLSPLNAYGDEALSQRDDWGRDWRSNQRDDDDWDDDRDDDDERGAPYPDRPGHRHWD
ncbi:MAG: hypothetical protein QM742_10845 [Aquabacterium sp.]